MESTGWFQKAQAAYSAYKGIDPKWKAIGQKTFESSQNPESKPKKKYKYRELHDILKASYQPNDIAKSYLRKHHLILDEELSGQRAKVFVNREGQPSIVYRGTKTAPDLLTDLKIATGYGESTNRVRHAKELHEQVKKKYRAAEVDTYGHSLGGYLAEKANPAGKVITFNKLNVGSSNDNERRRDIRTVNDIPSILTSFNRKTETLYNVPSNPVVSHMANVLKEY